MFPFRASLNASTLFPFNLDILQQIHVAAEAGYEGIEIWMKDLQAYVETGGSTANVKNRAADLGIEIVNAISFIPWADSDETVRSQALIQADEELTLLSEIGCPSFAAPPFGDVENSSLDELAIRFATLHEHIRDYNVDPILEFWGRAKKLSRLSEAVYVAMQSRVPDVKLLLDPFHMYTGGSSLGDLAFVPGHRIGIVHANDYPASPAQDSIGDAERVFPGDGVAPSAEFANLLASSGYRGYLSLELFVPDFGGKSAMEVASHGLAKIKSAYAI
jgi:sugar phosphate isomerase/epimerase